MDKSVQQESVCRLRSVAGHVRGIIQMVEEERSWVDIIQQIQAVHGSLKQAQMFLIRQHLDICLCDLDGQDAKQLQLLREELIALLNYKN
jgi:DNA-binding FrmR family transcriptional regulator